LLVDNRFHIAMESSGYYQQQLVAVGNKNLALAVAVVEED
jgi:hypothetical protein